MKKLIFFIFLCLGFFPNSVEAIDCQLADKINVNIASKEELECFDGVGPVTADNILDFLAENDPFSSSNDLQQVHGIGSVTADNIENQGLIVFEGETVFEKEDEGDEDDQESKNEDQEKEKEDKPSAHSGLKPVSKDEPEIDFGLSAGRDRLVLINAPIEFEAEVFDLENIEVSDIDFYWSFGDGYGGLQRGVEHQYKHPGQYVVVVNAEYQDFQATARIKVDVVENDLVLSFDDNLLSLKNEGKQEVNVGGFSLIADDFVFDIVDDTIILPNNSIKFSLDELKLSDAGLVELKIGDFVMAKTNIEEKIAKEDVDEIVDSIEDLALAFESANTEERTDTDLAASNLATVEPTQDANNQEVIESEEDTEEAERKDTNKSQFQEGEENKTVPLQASVSSSEEVDRERVLYNILNTPSKIFRSIFGIF